MVTTFIITLTTTHKRHKKILKTIENKHPTNSLPGRWRRDAHAGPKLCDLIKCIVSTLWRWIQLGSKFDL